MKANKTVRKNVQTFTLKFPIIYINYILNKKGLLRKFEILKFQYCLLEFLPKFSYLLVN